MRSNLGLLLIPMIVLLISCGKSGKELDEVKNSKVVINIAIKDTADLDLAGRIGDIEYIKLENTGESEFFSVDKLEVRDSLFYILDITGLQQVLVFTSSGKFLRKIGQRGFAQDQYQRIADFEVDIEGNVLIYDRQHLKIIKYSDQGSVLSVIPLDFRADSFNRLNNDEYIFSLTNEDMNSQFSGAKLIVTDREFKPKKKLLQYPEGNYDNVFVTGLFTESGENVVYNKPVNDSVYVFGKNGEIVKTFYFDFGSDAVPSATRLNYDSVVTARNTGNFKYIYKTPHILGDLIFANVFFGSGKGIFIGDVVAGSSKHSLFKPDDLSVNNVNIPIGSLGDSCVVSFLDYEFALMNPNMDMPDDVKAHMKKNDGQTLVVYHIKKKGDDRLISARIRQ